MHTHNPPGKGGDARCCSGRVSLQNACHHGTEHSTREILLGVKGLFFCPLASDPSQDTSPRATAGFGEHLRQLLAS